MRTTKRRLAKMSKGQRLTESLELVELPPIGPEDLYPLTLEELPPITGDEVELVFPQDDETQEAKE